MSKNCEQLHLLFSSQKIFKFPFNPSKLPNNGIYILFEDGEFAHGTRRVVRVGTHTGRDQLRSRLRQHFMQENKDRSIFRKNIGRALLKKAENPFLEKWELDLTTRKARERYKGQIDDQYLISVEKMVSDYLQKHFSFVAFEVIDKETRLSLESRIISTISNCEECKPSLTWLGLHSPKAKIRESGLWLVNELYKESLNESEFESLKSYLGKAP